MVMIGSNLTAAKQPHGSSFMPDADTVKGLLAKSVQAQLPKAIHEATGELVSAIVGAQLMPEIQAMLRQSAPGLLSKGQPQTTSRSQLANIEDPQGLLYDPFQAMDQMGFRDRPTQLTFRTLADMARRVPPYTAYLQTRLNQLSAFAEPQPDEHSLGFKFTLRDKRAQLDKKMQKRADELVRWMQACGDPTVKIKRDKFGAWLKKFGWDSLVYDQGTSEVVRWKGTDEPCYLRVLDASTIRIVDTLEEVDYTDDSIQYVQIYDDTIIGEFTEEKLIFGVRNPRSDIRFSGYGFPELEMLISIVTALLWGIDYNAKFFSQGSVAKGVLNFKGAVPEKELHNFRRQWYSMITGVGNAWRTPVVNADDVQWLDMHQSNRDMEFANWIDWLLKITCAICQIAPEEIGFQFGNGGQTSSLSEGSQADKLSQSKDKGLSPLCKFVCEHLNDKVIHKLDDRFDLEFAGLNARTAEGLIALQDKEVRSVKTVDEVRKERGQDPLPDGLGEVILDQTWLAFYQAKQQEKGAGGDGYGLPPGSPQVDSSDIYAGGSGEDDGKDNNGGDDDGDDAPANNRQRFGAQQAGMQKALPPATIIPARPRPGIKRPAGFGLSAKQAKALTFDVEM